MTATPTQGFGDLAKYRNPNLVLTIDGHSYEIPQPNARDGLRIRQLFALEYLSDATEVEEIMKLLGAKWVPDVKTVPVIDPATLQPAVDEDGEVVTRSEDHGMWSGGLWDEMVANGVSWDDMLHAGRTALVDVGVGRIAAQAYWESPEVATVSESEGNPQPVTTAPNRESRRAKKAPAKKATPKSKPAVKG